MVIIGCDHAGFNLKEEIKCYLQELNEDIVDIGAYTLNPEDDFNTYLLDMVKAFKLNMDAKIIAICGSGVGMNIGLNKTKGIFCVLGHGVAEVETARLHNNVNALSLGGRVTEISEAKKMIDCFLNTKHLGGKYLKRMQQIEMK